MSAMVREMGWDVVARQEGQAIVDLSSTDVEEVSGGLLWLPIAVGVAIVLLWPEIAE